MRRFTEETQEIIMLSLGLKESIDEEEDPKTIDDIIFGLITDLKIVNESYEKEYKKCKKQ